MMGMGYSTQSCLRKQRFASKREAEQALERYRAMGYPVGQRVAYGCAFCGGGHIGHRRGSKPRR
jgi:hypothetical protein